MDWIGYLAATFTTLAYLPQVIKTWRSKSAEDLSWSTFSMIFIGVVLWLLYGLVLDNGPMILANIITLVLIVSILLLKLNHSKR